MEFVNGQFEQEDTYFREVMQLSSDFNWIYKSRNTDILADGILRSVPEDWIPILQLNCFDNIQTAIKGECNVIANLYEHHLHLENNSIT